MTQNEAILLFHCRKSSSGREPIKNSAWNVALKVLSEELDKKMVKFCKDVATNVGTFKECLSKYMEGYDVH